MKQKKEFSKILCMRSLYLFIFCCLVAMASSFFGYDGTVFMYIIPSAGTVTGVCLGFYFFKAKSENMVKVRLNFVLMKVLLEGKLNAETYQEVCTEIENIDIVMNEKINNMTSESVNEEESISSIESQINNNIMF